MNTIPSLSGCRYLAAAAMLLPSMYAQGQQPRVTQTELYLDKISRQQLIGLGAKTGIETKSQARTELGLQDDSASTLRQPLQGGIFSHAELEFSSTDGKLERARLYVADPKPWSEVNSKLKTDLPCPDYTPKEVADGTVYSCTPGLIKFFVNRNGNLDYVLTEKNEMVIRVGGNVMRDKLVHQPPPVYPPEAKAALIQGTVRFDTLIARDGTIKQLVLVSGHPLLVPAAQTAVQQWQYQPTTLNGSAVEVKTLIDVNFALR